VLWAGNAPHPRFAFAGNTCARAHGLRGGKGLSFAGAAAVRAHDRQRHAGDAGYAAAATAPPSGSLTNRLAQLADQARAADRRFSERRGSAERLIAGGSGRTPGSEGWSVATVALADLASSRSDAMMALAELDRIYVDESIAAAETGDRSSIDAITVVRDQVTALISAQDETLARLHGRISG
jgi:predicted dienelactone hydrolase